MDEKTKALVEAAERRANAPIGASLVIPEPVYDDFKNHKSDVRELCAAVRELDAENERMRELLSDAATAINYGDASEHSANIDRYDLVMTIHKLLGAC